MRTRLPAAALFALALAVAAGCSSSTHPASSDTSTSAPPTSVPGNPGATASGASGSGTGGGVPAVAGGTDLTKEPTIAAGTGAAPTSVVTKDLVVGTGTAATDTNTVKVQYVGALYQDGKVFDASWTDNGPASFPLNGVIPGFKDAIVGMHIGGRREVVIPPAEGYGAAGSPPAIPANATLVFVIDLLAVS